MSAPEHRYLALDGLRGFAVLLVFCVHAAGNAAAVVFNVDLERTSFAELDGVATRTLFWLFRSHHGVFLFFVLSGFLIGRMWWPAPTMTYARFAWRRSLRIYPAFLVSFAASLAFAYYSGTWSPPDWPRVGGNLLFLNGAPGSPIVPFNLVTWSLFYEMTFYFAFPWAAIALMRRPGPRAGMWLFAGVLIPIIAVIAGANVLVLCWSLLFIGVALAVDEDAIRAQAARVPAAVIVAGYLVVTTAAMLDLMPPSYGIVAFGFVALCVMAKSLTPGNVISRLLTGRALRALGRVSYSFYLVHWMIVVLVARAVESRTDAWLAVLAIFIAGFALSAVAATLLWRIAERPYFDWVKGR